MTSILKKLPDNTLELTITIPWKRVQKTYQETLATLAKKAEIKGFRQGKAPLKLVEQKLGKTTLYEEVLKTLIPQAYLEAVKEQKLKPIVSPQIKIISLQEGKDWQIQALTCEQPAVKLGDYQGEIRKALASEKIWVPGKDKESAQPNSEKDNQRLQKILTILLKTAQVKIPALLIDQEVNRMLAKLIDQTNHLGLTVEQYLASIGKSNEQLKEEYRKQAEESLKLEFILAQIAKKQGIKIEEKEVDQMIKAVPDEETQKKMNHPAQRAYLRQLLKKRRVIDNLMKLL